MVAMFLEELRSGQLHFPVRHVVVPRLLQSDRQMQSRRRAVHPQPVECNFHPQVV